MDKEKLQRRQNLKVICSEVIMVITVIITVTILAFVVSGYWINSDFKLERQGMLQVSSVPTGADVEIDGNSAWLQRTNTSKVLASGEHTVTLTKDGYDTWTKTVDIKEGLLYRLHYPRLFLNNRTSTKVLDIADITSATISPDRKALVLFNSTTAWQYVDLTASEIKPVTLDIANYFTSVSLAPDAKTGLFTGEILAADWDTDARHLLLKVKSEAQVEWVLLDVKEPAKSLNLSQEFGGEFSSIKILDNSSNNLLVIQNGNLHKIDIPGRSISAVLASNVTNFDHYEREMIFITCAAIEIDDACQLYHAQIDGTKKRQLAEVSPLAQAVISKFYDQKYITILDNNQLSVYTEQDFTKTYHQELSFTPRYLKVGHNGEFVIAYLDQQFASLDMEADAVREWSASSAHFGWLDYDMLYAISDGELTVYDFDGFNARVLAHNASSLLPAGITDDKWLYYFSDGSLVREIISD